MTEKTPVTSVVIRVENLPNNLQQPAETQWIFETDDLRNFVKNPPFDKCKPGNLIGSILKLCHFGELAQISKQVDQEKIMLSILDKEIRKILFCIDLINSADSFEDYQVKLETLVMNLFQLDSSQYLKHGSKIPIENFGEPQNYAIDFKQICEKIVSVNYKNADVSKYSEKSVFSEMKSYCLENLHSDQFSANLFDLRLINKNWISFVEESIDKLFENDNFGKNPWKFYQCAFINGILDYGKVLVGKFAQKFSLQQPNLKCENHSSAQIKSQGNFIDYFCLISNNFLFPKTFAIFFQVFIAFTF